MRHTYRGSSKFMMCLLGAGAGFKVHHGIRAHSLKTVLDSKEALLVHLKATINNEVL